MTTLGLVLNLICLLIVIVAIPLFLWRWLKGTRDPSALLFRWILTAFALAGLIYGALQSREALEQGQFTALFAVIYALLGGIFLAIVWVPVLVEGVSNKIGSLYDGGNAEVEPKPFYSIAQARRSKGDYQGAVAEVRRQLEKFPADYEGHMLMAALQAENLNDLPGAELTIERLCAQPGHAPANIADAYYRLADWHLQLTKDPDSARAALQKIIDTLPDTEMALTAAQRIGHLANVETLLAAKEKHSVAMKSGVVNLGLLDTQDQPRRIELDPAQEIAGYVRQLDAYPFDADAREKLAVAYVRHYHRLDLAEDQLEQLIQQPNQPAKLVIHWLNLAADLQVQEKAEPDRVRATLQRIIDLYPAMAGAQTAQRRIDTLKLEFRVKEGAKSVRLGVYEQNVGLNSARSPNQKLPVPRQMQSSFPAGPEGRGSTVL